MRGVEGKLRRERERERERGRRDGITGEVFARSFREGFLSFDPNGGNNACMKS